MKPKCSHWLLARSIDSKNDEAPSSNTVTSGNKTIRTLLPLHTIEGCDVWHCFRPVAQNEVQHCTRKCEREWLFSRFEAVKTSERIFKKKSQLILSPIVALPKQPSIFPGFNYFALQCSSQFKTLKTLMFLNSLTEDPNTVRMQVNKNSANIVGVSIALNCLLCLFISWSLLFVVSGLVFFSLFFFFNDVMVWLSKPPVPGPWWPVIMRGRQSTPENVIHDHTSVMFANSLVILPFRFVSRVSSLICLPERGQPSCKEG